jgi:hypothetical protein
MKLLTIFELAPRNDNELHATYRDVCNELTKSEKGSADRRNALASLENIERAIISRPPQPLYLRPIEKALIFDQCLS